MLDKSKFMRKYNISEDSFTKSTCSWDELKNIHNDFCSKEIELLVAGNQILERLRLIAEVHSLKIRIKDPEHLIEKIIRKKEENPERVITIENYFLEVTDLIGLRALHLFKDEWLPIHESIICVWETHEQPTAYVRSGDPDKFFIDNGCKVKSHDAGYRSVHYVIKTQPTKTLYLAEVQVRTIFEEGWSEIDHRLRYPYDINNDLLNEYLKIFNRLAGSSDEMGSYIKFLKAALVDREAKYDKERVQFNNEKDAILKEMEKLKGKLKSEAREKEELQNIIDSLKKSSAPSFGFGIIGHNDNARKGMASYIAERAAKPRSLAALGSTSKTCSKCGFEYQGGLGISGLFCPNCGNSTYL